MLALPPKLPDAPAAYSVTNEAAFRTALTRYFQQQRTDAAVVDPSQAASPLNGTLVKSIGGGVLGNTRVTEAGTLLTVNESLTVAGTTVLGAGLSVAGAAALGSTLGVTGATLLGGSLGVTGTATFTSDLLAAVDGTPALGARAASRFLALHVTQNLWAGTAATTTVIAGLDSCADVAGQAWVLHTPDYGFTGWEYSGSTTNFVTTVTNLNQVSPGTQVVNNQASGSNLFARCTNNLQDDNYDYSAVFYDCGFNVNPQEAGLYILAPNSGTTYQVGEGLSFTWEKHTSGNLLYAYRNASGVTVDSSIVGFVSTTSAGRCYIQVQVRGTSLAVYTWRGTTGTITPTLLGTVTMSAAAQSALRDGTHQRVGIYMTNDVSGNAWSVKNITFTPTAGVSQQADGFAGYLNAPTSGTYADGGGLYIGNHGAAGLSQSEGLLIGDQSGSVGTSYALRTQLGPVQFGDALTLLRTLTVHGASTLTGAVTMASTLGVTGAITGSSTIQGTTITATTRFTGPLLGTTSAVDVVFDRNSVTQLTLGSLAATFAGTVQGTQLKSTIATGTAPLTVTSTTLVSNLTSQYLGAVSQDAAYFLNPTHLTNFGSAGNYLRSTGSAWAVVAGIAAADVNVGALANGMTATTQTPGDNTTKLSTTAFVTAAIAAYTAPVTSVFGRTGAVVAATNDYAFSQVSGTIATGQVSGVYGGITGVGTLASGAVPASLVTAGTFGTGAYVFPSTLKVSTLLGVNTAPTPAALAIIGGAHPTSGSVQGLLAQPTANTGVTSMQAVQGRLVTPGSTYTLGTAITLFAASPVIGSGDTLATNFGVRADDQGGASVGTSYAFYANTQSTSVTNTWAFYSSGTTQSHFGGPLSLVGTQPSTNFDRILSVGYNGAAHPSASTGVFGVNVDYSIPTTATSGSYPFWGRHRWVASGVYNALAVFAAAPPVTAAGATAVSSIGFWAQNQGLAGVTSSYGLLIDDQTGATNNYAIKTGAGLVQFGDQVKSTVATGTAPFVVASTTVVANLHAANSDQLGGTVAASYALLASPTFTGSPVLPTGTTGVTQTANTNSTRLATTAYVDRVSGAASSTPANPTGTTSTTAQMMGCAGAFTPTKSPKACFTITGQVANGTIADGSVVQVRYGTGSAPANAAALTGTQVGASQTYTAKVAAQFDGFCIGGIVSGLTIGTAYWIDVALNSVTGGTSTVTSLTITATEE